MKESGSRYSWKINGLETKNVELLYQNLFQDQVKVQKKCFCIDYLFSSRTLVSEI